MVQDRIQYDKIEEIRWKRKIKEKEEEEESNDYGRKKAIGEKEKKGKGDEKWGGIRGGEE